MLKYIFTVTILQTATLALLFIVVILQVQGELHTLQLWAAVS